MTYASEVTADSPIVWYRLGEASGSTAVDASTGGHNGSYLNSPTLGVTGALVGDTDTAVTFLASGSQTMQTAFWSGLNLTTFTIECWVKTTGSNQAIGGRQGTTSAPYVVFVDTSGKFQLSIKTSGTSGTLYTDTGAAINNGAWHHLVVTRDNASGDVKFYVDGSLSSTAASTVAPNVTLTVGLAVSGRGGTPRLDGSVDEFAIYSTALSSTRIAAHYTAGTTAPAISGTFTATLPHPLTASFTGTYREAGSFSATLPKVTASLTGTYTAPPTGTFAATLPVVTASFAGTYTAPPTPTGDFTATLPVVTASFAGDYHPHEAGTFDAVLPFPTADFTGTYTPGLETGTFAATLPVLAADFAGTYTAPGDTATLDAVLPLVVAAFVGTYDGPISTDTSNFRNGRSRHGSATVTITRAVAAPPATLVLAAKYDKAAAYPTPTMVDGRPT